ncbi:hypothetical protein GCM10022237_24770 [Nocardioides ginsengisoli]|uniref:Uncharacterized protein n=1 Tax=Nocardioides ginsengisoli TaxID=363868 RepID=A0ABW3W4P5_9ACTN
MTFALLLDDAAIFPPGNLPLDEAVAAHHAHLRAPYAGLVGPLVVSAAALPGLAGLPGLPGLAGLAGLAGAGPIEIAVVAPDAEAAAAALAGAPDGAPGGVRVVALEVTDGTDLRTVLGDPAGVTVFVEVPRDERRDAVIAELVGTPYRAKLRTGGVRADLYPDEAELAAAVVALTRAGVPFKATAGLHHALRNTDPDTGFEQHGFLNLLAATDAAERGADVDEVAAILAVRDHRQLPALPTGALLGSIGTCSITDPVDELSALGLLPEGVR